MSTTQIKTRDANGATFADPASPDFVVRFKTTSNTKNLNGVSVDNYITEIIINDANEVSVGTTSANDALAVRLRVSGSILSQDRLKAILSQMALQVDTWASENVLLGFEPSTAPVNPA